MLCNCGKQFSDEYAFCPFCGKKVPAEEPHPQISVYEALPAYSDYLLESFAQIISGKKAEEIRHVLTSRVDAPTCFVKKQVRYIPQVTANFSDVFRVSTYKSGYYVRLNKTVFVSREDAEEEYKRYMEEVKSDALKRAREKEEQYNRTITEKRRERFARIGYDKIVSDDFISYASNFRPTANENIWAVIFENQMNAVETMEAIGTNEYGMLELAYTEQPEKPEILSRINSWLKRNRNG